MVASNSFHWSSGNPVKAGKTVLVSCDFIKEILSFIEIIFSKNITVIRVMGCVSSLVLNNRKPS